MKRRRLTQQERADRRWERMKSTPPTMGLVGIFADLAPTEEHVEHQIQVEEMGRGANVTEGDGPTKITLPRRTPPAPGPSASSS